MRSCSNCLHALKEMSGQHSCRRNQPVAVPVMGMSRTTGQARMTGQISIFPIVEPNWHCGEFTQVLDLTAIKDATAKIHGVN